MGRNWGSLVVATSKVAWAFLQGIENYEREKALYDGIVLEYLELEDIVRNQSNPGGPFDSTLHTVLPKVLAYLEWWWKCVLRGPVLRYSLDRNLLVRLMLSLSCFNRDRR